MGKIAKGVTKINITMLYGDYCYIIIENFPPKFSPSTDYKLEFMTQEFKKLYEIQHTGIFAVVKFLSGQITEFLR